MWTEISWTNTTDNLPFGVSNQLPTIKSGGGFYCENFKTILFHVNEEGIFKNTNGTLVGINLSRSKIEPDSLESFINWIKANPTTYYYELPEPIISKRGGLNETI